MTPFSRHKFLFIFLFISLFLTGNKVAFGGIESDVAQAARVHEAFQNLELRTTSAFSQLEDGELKPRHSQEMRLLLHNGRIRRESLVRNPDGSLSYSDTRVFDGDKTIWYRPSQKTATIDKGRRLGLGHARLVFMSTEIGGKPLSYFQIRPEDTSLRDVVKVVKVAPYVDSGEKSGGTTYYLRRPLRPEEVDWLLFPAGHEEGKVVLYATGLFDRSHAAKIWLDPANNWLIVRQEFYDRNERLVARFEVEEIAGGFPRRCTLTQFGPSDDKQVAQQFTRVEVEDVRLSPSVTASDFEIDIPPGVYVIDRIADTATTKGHPPPGFADDIVDLDSHPFPVGDIEKPEPSLPGQMTEIMEQPPSDKGKITPSAEGPVVADASPLRDKSSSARYAFLLLWTAIFAIAGICVVVFIVLRKAQAHRRG